MTLARPASIVWFERLFLVSLLFRAVELPFDFEMVSDGLMSPAVAGIRLLFSVALPAALVLLVTRRRSNVAKWCLMPFFALTLLAVLGLSLIGQSVLLHRIIIPVALLQGAAIFMLFTAPARRWLDRKDLPPTEAELRQTFD